MQMSVIKQKDSAFNVRSRNIYIVLQSLTSVFKERVYV